MGFPAVTNANISLPLQGYYRPDRYMPVHIDSATTALTGDGIVPTIAESPVDSIVPLLINGSPATLNTSLKLQRVADNERLIAIDSDTKQIAQELFPQDKLVTISVNPSDPIPGPAVAWEALDAIVLDPTAMARIDDPARSTLLATGMILAVVTDTPPDSRWPWKHQGALWILRLEPAGPAPSLIDPSVFSPTYSWTPQAPSILRRQILVAGVLLGIAVIALALWRSKAALPGILSVTIFATAAVVFWHYSLKIVDQAGGDILVMDDSLTQRDFWLYERGRGVGVRRLDWKGSTHPVFASIAQLQQTHLRVVVGESGQLAFEYDAVNGQTLAIMRREVRPDAVPMRVDSRTSPMRELVKEDYLTVGRKIAGEQSAATGRWNTVIITPISDR